ncbi:MAG: hypothetical protein PQJ46_09340 [Spirochaetales bacterium]|nr:hypothetical protein [Spirochaetales bacterium]
MINKTITRSRKFQHLEDDFYRLLYCMILPFLDRDGKTEADPLLIKADCFPLRSDIDESKIQAGLVKLDTEGLIKLYMVDGEQYLKCLNFEKNQDGLRYDREPESRIPEPVIQDDETIPSDDIKPSPDDSRSSAGRPPAECRNDSGKLPVEEKRREIQKKENKRESQCSATVLISATIKHWNSFQCLPPCKYEVPNLPDIRNIIIKFDTFGIEDIKEAITYLSKYWEEIPKKFRPRSFHKFIINSLDSWLPTACPWERFQTEEPKKETYSQPYKPPVDNRPDATPEEASECFDYFKKLSRHSNDNGISFPDIAEKKKKIKKQAEQLLQEVV